MPDTTAIPPHASACLILADGTLFFGHGAGSDAAGIGEICFNTGMTGYQETLTDPSYARQIIVFTAPHIGNTGCNGDDNEAQKPLCSGLVMREKPTEASSFRSGGSFDDWLKTTGVTAIYGVDTRAITRHIRRHGAQNAAIARWQPGDGNRQIEEARTKLRAYPSMAGQELAEAVSTQTPYEWTQGLWKLAAADQQASTTRFHVVAIDYGNKLNILRSLAERGCKVTVVPAKTSAGDILAYKPDGIFLSNGPGDPAATGIYAVPVLQELIASGIPIFGICLGHQLLGLALGGATRKLVQGHRGANQPVKNLATGAVEITSQNHGFAVVAASLPANVEVTHMSLFDDTVEGLRCTDKPVFAVQYHPESSPGPHDSQYLFDQFVKMMESHA
jgi:carbamoyl-phosphate synthase small subunit